MSPLIGVLVIGIGLAFILGTLVQRFRLPPLVGYLLAGVVVGPFSPGLVIDQKLTLEMADIGVVLLMFGVGLHFKPSELLEVKGTAAPGAVLQMVAVACLLQFGLRLVPWTRRHLAIFTVASLVVWVAILVGATAAAGCRVVSGVVVAPSFQLWVAAVSDSSLMASSPARLSNP